MGREPSYNIAAVDELCRLALHARRLGCRVVLVDVDSALRDLLKVAGVEDLLVDDPESQELS
jgi:hypothetical protein